MKLIDRQRVEGTTEPVVYIGHRAHKTKNGRTKTARTWYAEYCLDAHQKQESLGTSNKNRAITLAHELAGRLRRYESPVSKRRVELEELVKSYMEYQTNKGRAPKTIEKYDYVLGTLVKWATDAGRESASAFTTADYWSFHKRMVDDGLTAKTRYDRLIIIKQLFKWAVKTKLMAHNPVAGETIPEPDAARQPCFTAEQVGLLLDKADPHEAAIFSVMAFAGLRFGEVQQLRWTDLILTNDGGGFIVVQRGGSGGTTKGKRSRRIPIHPELRNILDKLPRQFGLIFTARPSPKHPDGDSPISERRLLVSLKRLCRRCELPDPMQYKLHTFRHAFASMLARSNESYKYALEFMGHKDSKILDLYYTMYDGAATTAIKTIDYPRAATTDQIPAA